MILYSFFVYACLIQLLKSLDRYIRNFIWAGDTNVKKVVIVAWKYLCRLSMEGGLGLKTLRSLNEAALMKLSWEMHASNQEWAEFYISRFVHLNKPIIKYVKSSVWPEIKANLHIPCNMHKYLKAFVADFIQNSKWLIPAPLLSHFPPIVVEIDKIIIPQACSDDMLVWQHSSTGQLSLKDAFLQLNPPNPHAAWCKLIWNPAIPPSKSFIS